MESAKHENDRSEFLSEVIHTYTRAQAIEDGILIDVTETARESGFRWPVAITQAAWLDCVAWCDEDSSRQTFQDQSGRLWDVVWMAFQAIRRARNNGAQLMFSLYRVPRGGRATRARLTQLKLMAGPGDNGEAVLTIWSPQED